MLSDASLSEEERCLADVQSATTTLWLHVAPHAPSPGWHVF